eukprot:TRINITY_DN22548_c0_g1_i1.p1 TRINITY_DN22548_c0_g1~~TRINITY_DN22548_c0_g1_i1.p1  ORF type:complete len:355 (+),score=112.08 TRINITY_DN22548_c0_g1_i1:45-1067(+)
MAMVTADPEAAPAGAGCLPDALPDYWVPLEDEQGLLEVLALLPDTEVVYLHTRPIGELQGNMVDYVGDCIDLSQDVYVKGKGYVLRQRAARALDTDVYPVSSIEAMTQQAMCSSYVAVKYRDWSRWAVRANPRRARGGFGAPAEGGIFPFVINPFARAHVDRCFVVVVGHGPGYLLPITEEQFILACSKTHENTLSGKKFLTQQQYDEVASYQAVRCGADRTLPWETNPLLWPRSQQLFTGVCGCLCISNLFIDSDSSRGTLRKLAHVVQWTASGFAAARLGTFLASQQGGVTAEAPITAAFAGLLSLATPAAAPIPIFAAFAALANYRVAVLQPEAVSC